MLSSRLRRRAPLRFSDSRQLLVPVHHCQVTVSTVGLVSEMQRFTASSRAQLAVSLHATTDEVGTCTWAPASHAGCMSSHMHGFSPCTPILLIYVTAGQQQ